MARSRLACHRSYEKHPAQSAKGAVRTSTPNRNTATNTIYPLRVSLLPIAPQNRKEPMNHAAQNANSQRSLNFWRPLAIFGLRIAKSRICPCCASDSLFREPRAGLSVKFVCFLFHVRPYRCLWCDAFFFSRKFGTASSQPRRSPREAKIESQHA
jgi:hypothetical protein